MSRRYVVAQIVACIVLLTAGNTVAQVVSADPVANHLFLLLDAKEERANGRRGNAQTALCNTPGRVRSPGRPLSRGSAGGA